MVVISGEVFDVHTDKRFNDGKNITKSQQESIIRKK